MAGGGSRNGDKGLVVALPRSWQLWGLVIGGVRVLEESSPGGAVLARWVSLHVFEHKCEPGSEAVSVH